MRALPANGIDVRVATLDDAPALAALLSEMDDEPGNGASLPAASRDGERMREVLAEMAAYPNYRAYLLRDESGPIGTFSLMVFSSPSHGGAVQALLEAVVVARGRRGEGLGETMLRHAMDIAVAAGCYKMSLSSNLKRIDAHRFYERIGFRQHGISFSTSLGEPA